MPWQLVIDLLSPCDLIIDGKVVSTQKGQIIVPFATEESAMLGFTVMRSWIRPVTDDFDHGETIQGKVIYHDSRCAHGSQEHDGPCIPRNILIGEAIRDSYQP